MNISFNKKKKKNQSTFIFQEKSNERRIIYTGYLTQRKI